MQHPLRDCMKRWWRKTADGSWQLDAVEEFNQDLEQTIQRILGTNTTATPPARPTTPDTAGAAATPPPRP